MSPVAPTITAVTPNSGPEAGGTSVTITGTRLNTIKTVTIGGVVFKARDFVVNGDGTSLTFVTPGGYGTVDDVLSDGLNEVADSFTYIPPANPTTTLLSATPNGGTVDGGTQVTLTGTHLERATEIQIGGQSLYAGVDFTVSDDGTTLYFYSPANPLGLTNIKLITATQQPTLSYKYIANDTQVDANTALDLNLALNLGLGSRLDSGQALLSGGGLQANSTFELWMHSTPVLIYSGTTDANGNFSNYVNIPSKACLSLGKHDLELSGIAPDGSVKKDTQFLVLDNACRLLGINHNAPVQMIKISDFLFGYNSAKLTKKAIKSLKSYLPLLVGSKSIDIYGYTQTNLKGKAAIAANKRLGLARSKAVRKWLKAHGINVQINVIGQGPVKPVSKKKQKLNRRVELSAHYMRLLG